MFSRSSLCKNTTLRLARYLQTRTPQRRILTGEVSAPFLHSEWKKDSPSGFEYAWLPEADTVTLVPNGWHTACEADEGSVRYIITKEDALANKQFNTGFVVSKWQCNEIPAEIVMDQVSTQHLGVIPSLYLSQFFQSLEMATSKDQRNSQFIQNYMIPSRQREAELNNTTYILNYLRDLNIHVIDYKTHNLPDIMQRKSIEFIKLQPTEQTVATEISPTEDTYVLSHVFALPVQNVVLSFLFECPVSQYAQNKPLISTILDYSVLGCHSKQNRVLFSDVHVPTKE